MICGYYIHCTTEMPWPWSTTTIFDFVNHVSIVQDTTVMEKENIVNIDVAIENATNQKSIHVSYANGHRRHRRIWDALRHTEISIINSLHELTQRLKF